MISQVTCPRACHIKMTKNDHKLHFGGPQNYTSGGPQLTISTI
uniref:Uncharacterized protein n=1 Tax=Arundo donax TaxID=35708 RepID=A0A0A9DJR8_ARUDO